MAPEELALRGQGEGWDVGPESSAVWGSSMRRGQPGVQLEGEPAQK